MPNPRHDLDVSTAAGVAQVRALIASRYGRVIERASWEFDDVCQSVLLRLLAHPYDPARGCVSSWVLRLTRNELRDRASAERRDPVGSTWGRDGPCDPAEAAVAPTDTAIREEHVQAYVRAAQMAFAPRSAALVEHVIRARVAGLSMADIARRTGHSRARVRQIIDRLPRQVPCATSAPDEPTTDTTDLPLPGATSSTRPRRRPSGWSAAHDYWRSVHQATPPDRPPRPGWLTMDQVRAIRAQYVPGLHGQRAVARALGLPRYTVARVLRGECYADRAREGVEADEFRPRESD